MIQIFLSGGWIMFPILFCSTLALAIIVERFWALRKEKIVPQNLLPTLLHHLQNKQINKRYLKDIETQSYLGSVLVKGLSNLTEGPEMMLLSMTEQGRRVIHQLERFLNALGTIATIAPLLGLLGTVVGMIDIFSVITISEPANSAAFASGISQALLTTAFGLMVAIPSLIFHRHFQRKIDEIGMIMEQEALQLAEFLKKMQSKFKFETAYEDLAA